MAVNVQMGTVEYRENGGIAVPVTFPENVIASKTVFKVTAVTVDGVMSDLSGVEYVLYGENTAFELVFVIPPDRKGRFRISGEGNVLKVATSVWDNIVVTALDVDYSTIVPVLINYDIPETYTFGENFDMRVAFNALVTGWHANNSFTEIWIEEGARLGTPVPYKWTGTTAPDFTVAVPDDLTGTDWQALSTPPGGHTGEWHGEEGKYFLMRIEVTNADAVGIAQFTLRPNSSLRGPVS